MVRISGFRFQILSLLYIFRAKNLEGKELNGEREAKNETDLGRALRGEGYFLIESKAKGNQKTGLRILFGFLTRRIKLVEKMIFARHLSVMVGAGLSLTKALNVLSIQTDNAYFKNVITGVGNDIIKGESFAGSLKKYPKVFNELFVNMVKVGEAGGNLEEVLKTLAYQMEKEHELRSKVKGALMYPSVIVSAMIIIGIIMMIFVVPKLTATFAELNVDLPVTTQLVIWISNFLANHAIIFILGFMVAMYLFIKAMRTKKGRGLIDFIFINTPFIRNITMKINIARMARALSSLLKSGVSITEAIEMVAGTLTNKYFSESLLVSAVEVEKGKNLSELLVNYGDLYPPIVTQMIAVGEETGMIDDILAKLADFYEAEVYNITKNLSTIIEPVLMIIIGAAVGFFAVSMLQPMYSIVESI